MTTVPLATAFSPERWKKAIYVMLENIPGVVHSNKLRIIQLMEADFNQLLRIAFARNIEKLSKNHKGIISDHHYVRAHATCMTPVINKLLTVQLLIQKRTEGIIFDNDAKGCYDIIIIGVVWVIRKSQWKCWVCCGPKSSIMYALASAFLTKHMDRPSKKCCME
jgi:hypothetical protein